LGHSAVLVSTQDLNIYIDPYFKDPVDWTKLPKGDLVLFSHGHFDHGVLLTAKLFEAWHCKFVAPKKLTNWLVRKHRRRIPAQNFISVNHNESIEVSGLSILATPAHHPMNRLGKTIMTLFARCSAPGKPVNGYCFNGYFHAGDTIYTPAIAESLKNVRVHTACLPIGGKYAVASPQEALRVAEELGVKRLVPLHWQALMQQVPFRYQSSDLVKLAKTKGTKIQICPLAIGELLEPIHDKHEVARKIGTHV
jgi:L-ascorbate metabolism protein UlaG (beta-lactamase superfamily)